MTWGRFQDLGKERADCLNLEKKKPLLDPYWTTAPKTCRNAMALNGGAPLLAPARTWGRSPSKPSLVELESLEGGRDYILRPPGHHVQKGLPEEMTVVQVFFNIPADVKVYISKEVSFNFDASRRSSTGVQSTMIYIFRDSDMSESEMERRRSSVHHLFPVPRPCCWRESERALSSSFGR